MLLFHPDQDLNVFKLECINNFDVFPSINLFKCLSISFLYFLVFVRNIFYLKVHIHFLWKKMLPILLLFWLLKSFSSFTKFLLYLHWIRLGSPFLLFFIWGCWLIDCLSMSELCSTFSSVRVFCECRQMFFLLLLVVSINSFNFLATALNAENAWSFGWSVFSHCFLEGEIDLLIY